MQAWGTTSRFDYRHTEMEPSKSGVIGLLCAALGRDRAEPLDDLAGLRMGVRVDREGRVLYDYQTALEVLKASGKSGETVQSWRFYLADAAFLVGLEGDDRRLLETLHQALRNPRWALFLGRKSYPPSPPVWLPDGLREESLEEALACYPSLVRSPGGAGQTVRYVLELPRGVVPAPGAPWVRRTDQPDGPFRDRRFVERFVWISGPVPFGEVPRVPVETRPERP